MSGESSPHQLQESVNEEEEEVVESKASDAAVGEEVPVFIQTQIEPEQTRISSPPQKKDRQSNVEMIARSLLGGEEVSNVGLREKDISSVLAWLTNYRNDKITRGNAPEAEHTDKIISEIQFMRTNNLKENARFEREEKIRERLDDAKKFAGNLQRRYSETRKLVLLENNEHIAKLTKKHEKEKQDMSNKWHSPEKARRYSHASNRLMTLRTQRFLLMNAGRYDEQKLAEQTITEIEQQEAEEAGKTMMNEYEYQLRLMNEHQKQEMNHLLMANQSRLVNLQRAEEREVSAAKRRIQNIELELASTCDSNKFWNVHGRSGAVSRSLGAAPVPKKTKTRAPSMNMKEICSLKLPPLKVPSRVSQTPKKNK